MQYATRATLYLGSNIGGKPLITETDFSLWLDDVVTPKFPGFTVRHTRGYWKGQPELSYELVILKEGQFTRQFRHDVEAIGLNYKTRFMQDAVMVTFEDVHLELDVPGEKPLYQDVVTGGTNGSDRFDVV